MKLSLSHKTIIVLLAMTLTFVCPNLCALPGPGEANSIPVMQNSVQGAPKESSILASINGHVLSVVFTENLGQVAIDISTAAGASVDYNSIHTPNGVAKHRILKQCLSPWRYPLSSSNRWASFSSNRTAFLISTMVCTGITRIAV